MHPEAHAWVAAYATAEPVTVLDVGGRNINGSNRDLFPAAAYTVLDIADGPGVDIIADAATWTPDREYDLVLCTEVFEHTPDWRQIIATCHKACRAGGRLVLTMAGPGRAEHSAVDGGWTLHPGEHYANIHPDELRQALEAAGWRDITVDRQDSPADVRASAIK